MARVASEIAETTAPPEVPDVSSLAAALGHRTRARMVGALMSGSALTATELAVEAGVASSTASEHLAQLCSAGVLAPLRQGRHRYYRVASAEIARAIEALMAASESVAPPLRARGPRDPAVRFARTCYDHLAGALAVAIADRLLALGALAASGPDAWTLNDLGRSLLSRIEIEEPEAGRSFSRRPACRPCLDWSERRHHLGGALGAAMLAAFQRRRWITRTQGSRIVVLTRGGRDALSRWIGIAIEQPAR